MPSGRRLLLIELPGWLKGWDDNSLSEGSTDELEQQQQRKWKQVVNDYYFSLYFISITVFGFTIDAVLVLSSRPVSLVLVLRWSSKK